MCVFPLACLVLALAAGSAWSCSKAAHGSGSPAADSAALGGLDPARLKNAVDIVEITNLHAEYTQALDAGRLDEGPHLLRGHGESIATRLESPIPGRSHKNLQKHD